MIINKPTCAKWQRILTFKRDQKGSFIYIWKNKYVPPLWKRSVGKCVTIAPNTWRIYRALAISRWLRWLQTLIAREVVEKQTFMLFLVLIEGVLKSPPAAEPSYGDSQQICNVRSNSLSEKPLYYGLINRTYLQSADTRLGRFDILNCLVKQQTPFLVCNHLTRRLCRLGHLHDGVILELRPESLTIFLSYVNLVIPTRFK